MASMLGSELHQDPYIPRPHSPMNFRNAWDSQPPEPGPTDDLRLTNYYTAPEPYPDAQVGLANSFYNDTQASQLQYQHAYEPLANAYQNPSYHPGDLATTQGFVEKDRSWLSDAVKRNQHVLEKPLQTIGKVIGGAIAIIASPFIGALSDLYVVPMQRQINDGRAKHLPTWLMTFCNGKYTNISVYSVRYGEHVSFKSKGPEAMTIGYDVFCTGGLDLNLDVPNSRNPGINDIYKRLPEFAYSVQAIMHEMEHTSQFFKAGGDSHLWVAKWAAQLGWAAPGVSGINDLHHAMQMEKDAEAKSWSLYSEALKYFARGRSTYPKQLFDPVTLTHKFGLGEGYGLKSPNGQYVCRLQADGNLVVYAPRNVAIWQSQSYGKACPPFWLVSSANRDSILVGGYTFTPTSYQTIWTTIWQSTPYRVPGELDGFYLVGSPTSNTLASAIALQLNLTDWGQLQAKLMFRDRHPLVIWQSVLPPGSWVPIESTTVTLPARY